MIRKFVLIYYISFMVLRICRTQDTTDYCSISPSHILCPKEGEPEYSIACGDPSKIIFISASPNEQNEILAEHNFYRSSVAEGFADAANGTKFPQASNMETLVWDEELAKIAETFAKQCTILDVCAECKATPTLPNVGAKTSSNVRIGVTPLEALAPWKDIIARWTVGQAVFYDVNEVDSFTFKANSKYPQLTQVIWATTKKIGCARIAFEIASNKYANAHYSCFYGPAGDIESSPVYKKGAPCTECGEGRGCSRGINTLCDPLSGRSQKLLVRGRLSQPTSIDTRFPYYPTSRRFSNVFGSQRRFPYTLDSWRFRDLHWRSPYFMRRPYYYSH